MFGKKKPSKCHEHSKPYEVKWINMEKVLNFLLEPHSGGYHLEILSEWVCKDCHAVVREPLLATDHFNPLVYELAKRLKEKGSKK